MVKKCFGVSIDLAQYSTSFNLNSMMDLLLSFDKVTGKDYYNLSLKPMSPVISKIVTRLTHTDAVQDGNGR